MGSKQQQRVTCHRQCPDWPSLFLCLVPLNLKPPAKFDVCSFILTGDNRGSQNSKVGHVTQATPLFGPIFHFYRASYASTVLAVIVCLSVCLSVTSRSCTKMAKPGITLTTPHDSPRTLAFRCQKSWRNSNDITPNGGAKQRWGRFESGDLYHRTTLPLRRSTAATLCSSAMVDANDAFALAESYRRTAINNVRQKSITAVMFISTDSVLARFRLHQQRFLFVQYSLSSIRLQNLTIVALS